MQLFTWWSSSGQRVATRLLDVSLSLAALVLVSPLLVAIAVAVKLSSSGPVIHRARRVGQGGRVFTLYKFRTMVADAARSGPAITAGDDPRVTAFGRALRRSKLDELPQLINTLIGNMSLVGPRPEDPFYVGLYSADQRRLLEVKPGITSPATVLHRDEERMLIGNDWEQRYRAEILPNKLRIELDYLSRRTLGGDLRILAQTAAALFRQPLVHRREPS
jgi:lipopolysaccharide/colanic/teichoic acid biosynthesis glycosyltransferase